MTWIPLAESIPELCRQVREWRGRGGVVVRAGQHLVKIKALSYLTLYRLRSDLTVRRIRETLEAKELATAAQWREHLEAQGGDWEVLWDTGRIVQTLLDARGAARIRFDALAAEATAQAAELPDRKAFAIRYATKLAGAERSAAFLIADGKRDRALERLTAAALDETVQTLRAGEIIAALEEQ